MENRLSGKRLLVLGGSMWKDAIHDYASQNNIVIISAGLYPAGIDDVAQEVYRIDTTDSERMKFFIKEHNIDGVYMGGSELIISSACDYINELGLPCYCTREQWGLLQNKRNFKELCSKYDIPVVPRFHINEDDIKDSLPQEVYPVITKPEDGCGSNGFSVCHTPEDLERGYLKAASNSPTGSVLCEKYVNNDSVVVFYTFSAGKMFFSGLENKYPVKYKESESYVAGLHLFESRYVNEFRSLFDEKLKRLFQHIGLKEGSLWIEVFHDGDEYYFNEVGFRYSGSVSIFPVDYFYGINQVASDIYYALTGKSRIFNHSSLIDKKVPHKKYYAIYNAHLRPGIISSIEGIDIIRTMPECVFIADTKHQGEMVKSSGTVAQVFAFIHFVFDTLEECKAIIDQISLSIHVKDENGNEMLRNMLDWDSRVILM